MRLLRHFVATLCLAALGLSALPAQAAGTLTFSPPTWRNRDSDRLINRLNREDCDDDAVASFSVSILNAPTGVFEVWSGAGCDQAANRAASAVNKTCVRVSAQGLTPINQRVDLHFRDMVAAYGTEPTAAIEECDASTAAGLQTRSLYFIVYDPNNNTSLITGSPAWKFNYDVTPPPPPSSVTAGSGDETLVTSFVAPAGETNLLQYHFYCSPIGPSPVKNTGGTGGTGGATAGGTTSVAPAGASGGTAGTAGTDTGGTVATAGTAGTDAGGTNAAFDVAGTTGVDTGGSTVIDTGGSTVVDSGGSAGTNSGGATGATAGTDATAGSGAITGTGSGTVSNAGTAGSSTTIDPTCTSSNLVPGEYPPAGALDCGVIAAQGAKGGETSPVLENDQPYAVAVATEDNVNNIGKLSGLACNIPKDITGFYEAYTEAGGQAGGGYCTFAPAHRDSLAFALLLVGAASALVRRRR